MAPGRATVSKRPRWITVGIGGALAGFLLVGGTTAPVASAMPEVTLTLAISPKHVGDTGVFTVTGTVTPTVPISGVKLMMMQTPGPPFGFVSCAPAGSCWADVAHVYFDLPSVGTKATVSAKYQVNQSGGPQVGFNLALNAPDVMVSIPKTVYGYGPTLKMSIARTAGIVMPGSTVHLVATATTSVGPVHGVLIQVVLPSGLEPPTHLSSATAVWNGDPYRTIEWATDFATSSALSFDSTATAALGTDLKVSGLLHPAYGWDTAPKGASLTVHVGPTATATPKPTPRPTPRPSPTATARVTPRPASSSVASPVLSAGATASPSPPATEGVSPVATAIVSATAASSVGLATMNDASPAPSSATTPDPSTVPAGALGAAGLAIAAAAAAGILLGRRWGGLRR